MPFEFPDNSRFSIIAIRGLYSDVPREPIELADGTVALPAVPESTLRGWEANLGLIQVNALRASNLLLVRSESTLSPYLFEDTNERLAWELKMRFDLMQLNLGMKYEAADSLSGCTFEGHTTILDVSNLQKFHPTPGFYAMPITVEWLDRAVVLHLYCTPV